MYVYRGWLGDSRHGGQSPFNINSHSSSPFLKFKKFDFLYYFCVYNSNQNNGLTNCSYI